MINISGTKLCKAVTWELLLVLIAGVLIHSCCREMLVTLRKIDFILYGGTVRVTERDKMFLSTRKFQIYSIFLKFKL